MDWILSLSLGTFALLIGFLVWNRVSTKRQQKLGDAAHGIGGKSDPLSGNTDEPIRSGDEIRADLDKAAASDAPPVLHKN